VSASGPFRLRAARRRAGAASSPLTHLFVEAFAILLSGLIFAHHRTSVNDQSINYQMDKSMTIPDHDTPHAEPRTRQSQHSSVEGHKSKVSDDGQLVYSRSVKTESW
jgi:hypothetical protein